MNDTPPPACPECGAPVQDGAAWCSKCGANLRAPSSGRASYAAVGAAIRQAHDRAVAAGDLTARDWRVLSAVIALVSSWSRITDRIAASQIAESAGVDQRHASRSLARLKERGVIVRGESRGRRSAAVGLPEAAPADAPDGPVDNAQPWPTEARVTDPPTMAEGDQGSQTNHGRYGPPTMAGSGQTPEKTEKKAFARETSGAAPPGSANGRPAPHATLHHLPTASESPADLEREPRLFLDEIQNAVVRSLIERAVNAQNRRQDHGEDTEYDIGGRDTRTDVVPEEATHG